MESNQNLELFFKSAEGRNTKMVLPYPKANLSRRAAEDAMNVIINSDLFSKDGFDSHATAVGARYVTREVQEIFFDK